MILLKLGLVFTNRFDVPLPSMWEVNGTQQLERRESEPLVVQMNPIFRSSDLQSNGHKRCDAHGFRILKLLQTSVKEKGAMPSFSLQLFTSKHSFILLLEASMAYLPWL
jgi:hypothetical protein